jgi:hypothetical protein
MPFAHPIVYPAPRPDSLRLPNLASPRDPEASAQLRNALQTLGYGFGETVLNFPSATLSYDLLPEPALTHVSLPFVRYEDMLFQTTRPPLSDGKHEDRKKIEPSNTNIERAIFKQYWRYFKECSRSYVELTEEAAEFLRAGKESRAAMTFFQDGCRYQYLQAYGGKISPRSPLGNRTAAFLLRVDELWEGGPSFIAAWGLNAISTLAWCTLLRTHYSGLLHNRGLTMVDLEPVAPPSRPVTHAWTQQWGVKVLLETGSELPARRMGHAGLGFSHPMITGNA